MTIEKEKIIGVLTGLLAGERAAIPAAEIETALNPFLQMEENAVNPSETSYVAKLDEVLNQFKNRKIVQ